MYFSKQMTPLLFLIVYLQQMCNATQLKSFVLTSPRTSNKLVPGGILTLQFEFTFESENTSLADQTVIFQGEVTPLQLDTSAAVINDTGQTITFTLSAANFNILGFGSHNCSFNLSSSSSETLSDDFIVSYEEQITNLQITCSSFQTVNTAANISLSLNSGSNIQLRWYINGLITTTSSDSGNGTRQLQQDLTLDPTGKVNISVNASNSVSSVVASATVYNYYRINGFQVTTSPSALSTDSVVTVKMASEAQLPQGPLSIQVLYIDGNSTVLNISSTEPTLQSGLNLTHRYSSIGSHTVLVMVTSPIETKTYNIISNVYDPISTFQVQCSPYQTVGHPIEFNVTITTGSTINLKCYINTALTFNKSYETHGEFTENRMVSAVGSVFISCTASNPVSEAHYNLTFTNLHPINGFSLIGDEVVRNANATVTLKLDSTSHLPQGNLSVGINFGDSTQIMNLISSSNESLKTTGLLFTHPYSNEGNYSVQVQLISPVDVKNYSTTVQVMEPTSGIQIHTDSMQTFDSPVNISVRLQNGYNVFIKWLINGEIVDTTFHSGKGIRTFEVSISPSVTGEVNITAIAHNAVSEELNSTIIYVYYAINGFSLFAHPSTIHKDASIILLRKNSANLPQGNLSIVIQYGDGNFTSLIIDAGDSSLLHPGYVFSYRYLAEDQYHVNASINSPVDEQVLTTDVNIIEEIQNITVLCFPEIYIVGNNIVINLTINDGFDVESKWYINDHFKFSIHHPGKGFRIYSDIRSYDIPGKLDILVNASNPVSYFIDSVTVYNYYQLGGFSIHGGPGSIYEDTNIFLTLAIGSPLPQGTINYIIEFGDGNSTSGNVSSTNANLMNPGLSFPKRYYLESFYEVSVVLVSPVGSLNLTSEIKIVEPIRNITLETDKYHEVGDPLVIQVQLIKGFNVTTTWFFGTAKSHVFVHEGTGNRYFNLTETIDEKGRIDITVVASNIVSQKNSSFTTYFYHRINGIYLTSSVASPLFAATLYIKTSETALVPQGVLDVNVDFGDGTNETVMLEFLTTTLIDPNLPITHLYQTEGNYTVTATLISPLGEENITSEVEVIEPISGIQFDCKSYLEVGEVLVINATLFGGMRVTTEWQIGRGTPLSVFHSGKGTRDFQLHYNVTDYGPIEITVNATNNVSSSSNTTTVFYLFSLNGFSVSHDIHSTIEEAVIVLTMDSSALMPMGQITVETVFGDGSSNTSVINGSDPSFISNGLDIKHLYPNADNYTLTISLTSMINSIDIISKIKILEPIYGIEFDCPKYVEVGREIEIHARLYGGHEVKTEWLFGNRSHLEKSHFGNGTQEFTVLHNVSGSGKINITVLAISPVSSASNSTEVFYYYAVNGFHIDGLTTLSNYNTTYLNFWLTANASNPMGDIKISIHFGDGNITVVDMDSGNSSLQTPGLVFSHMYQTFGDFVVNAQVTSHINAANYTVGVEMLEPIEEIQIWCPLYNIIGNKLPVYTKIVFGTKVHISWDFGGNDTIYQLQNGSGIRSVEFKQDVSNIGQVNVTVEARNAVSLAKNWTSIFYYFPIAGFYIQNNITVQTTEVASIFFKITENAPQPQGFLEAILSFGDGNSTYFNFSSDDSFLVSDGIHFDYMYAIQGLYHIEANLSSHVGTANVSSEIRVWDKLSVRLVSKTIATAGEKILFEFTNVPNSNFQYKIKYGDGDIKSNNVNDLYRRYDFTNWTKQYESDGVFTVNLKAWNEMYNNMDSYTILIEYPLIESLIKLFPEVDTIPIPDGITDFILNITAMSPTPSNVQCNFDFGQGEEKYNNTTISIAYGKPFFRRYQFRSHGIKNVTFYCMNSVSSFFKSSIITVLRYELTDIKVIYENPVNMNMTLKPRIPTPDNRNYHEAVSIPVDVKFYFDFLGCSRLPHNMTMSWNFADGSSTEVVNSTKLYHSHFFQTRNTFHISLDIIDNNKNENSRRDLSLQTGILTFEVSPNKGDLRDTIFRMSATGLLGEQSLYTFDSDSSNTQLKAENFIHDNVTEFTKAERHIMYTEFGYYIPKLTGANGSIIETMYLDYPLIADLNISQEYLTLDLPVSVPLPPGSVEYKIKITNTGDSARPYVNCTFNTGDEVDRNPVSAVYNITVSDPIRFDYQYIALGSPTLNISCQNSISRTTWSKSVIVSNPCFEVKEIFDRQYSMINFPLTVWTSEHLYISNRMAIKSCGSEQPKFRWDLYRVNKSGSSFINDNPIPLHSQSGTLFISKGSIKPDLYLLNLTVLLSQTFIFEYMYIRFKTPKPFAFIAGGSKISSRPSSYIVLDAVEKSHNSSGNYGDTTGLSFSWTCPNGNAVYSMTTETTFTAMANDSFNNATTIEPPGLYSCKLVEYSRGVAKLSLDEDVGKEIAVTVRVYENSSWDEFTQIISVVSLESPQVAINCTINCGKKIVTSSKATFMAWCKRCDLENATLHFEWKLWMKPTDTAPYEIVAGFSENTTTGVNVQSLAISRNFLFPGKEYRLVLNASYREDEGWSEAFYQFSTNYPPYGGRCEYNVEGEYPLVSVSCKNWADEGFQNDQDYTRDLNARLPLIYQYETRTMRNQKNGVENVSNIIYRGSESSIEREYIQVGDSSVHYTVYIGVKIFDFYGDYTAVQSEGFMVGPPSETQPTSETDVNTVQGMFNNFMDEYYNRNRSGNEMSAIRLIGTAASFFKNFSNADTTTTEYEIMTGAVQTVKIDNSKSLIVQEYQLKMAEMLDLLRVDLQVHCSSDINRYSIADYQIIFSSIDSVTRLQSYMTFDILINTTRLMDNLVACLEKVTNIDPFPVGYLETTYESVTVIHRIINRLLDVMLPNQLQDLSVPINKAAIKELLVRDAERQKRQEALLHGVNVSTLIDYSDLDNKANMLCAVREHFKGIQEEQVELARTYFPIIQRILKNTQTVILRTMVLGERHTMDRTVVSIITEKITVDGIENRTDEYFVGIQPSNGTFEQLTDVIVAMKINYFKKNPFIYGENASSLTSGVSTFDIGDDIKLDVKLANNGNFKYQKFIPLINPQYPEKMIFFTFDVVNNDDAAIIFMNPDGFDINNPVNFTLYTFYVRSDNFPTSSSYDFIKTVGMHDWEDVGFKIFLEQGLCPKGTCYLGVKPEAAPDYRIYTPMQMRRKREATQNVTTAPPAGNTFIPVNANFSLVVFTTGCRSWNDSQNAWSSEGCIVLSMSSVNDTVCRCSGNTFSTTFYVPPNMINFLTVFSKFDVTNAFVYGPLIGMLILYIIAAILLRREDKKDLIRWAVHFLVDHDGEDSYFYLLTVHTGMRRGAGTKSNVNFVLVGNDEDSGIRVLSDGIKNGFGVASIDRYFMGTKEPLGELKYLRIWHDNSGKGANKNWYLNRVIVDDLQEKDRYVFLCDKWLSLDDDDGMIERVLPVSTKENVNSFRTLLNENAQINVTDHHLWVSLLLRPNISRFTRVQRLTTLMVLLLLVMISNAMFFKSSTEDSSSMQFEIGFFRFSLSTLYVSSIGVIITTPPVLFVILAFRKSKVRKSKHFGVNAKNPKTMPKSDKYNTSESNNVLQALNEDIMFEDNNLILPFWCVYLSWIILVLAAAACSFFLLLYSMEWGKEKSEEWISSFLLSFLESFLIVDPLKVVFVSLVFATVLKNVKEEKPPSIDLDMLQRASCHYNGDSRQNFLALVNDILRKNEPPSESELQLLRRRRQEENRARKATYSISLYMLYIFVLFGASYLQRDLRSFNYKWNIENYLIANSNSQLGFSGINDTKDFFAWVDKTFIPTFYPEKDYRGETLSPVNKKWFGDNSSIRVGPARLRQLRSKREMCSVWSITWPKNCINKYSELEEDTFQYCLGWHPFNQTACSGYMYESQHFTANAWTYTSAKDIWGFSILGEYNSYSGGGYILEFTKNREQATGMLKELMKYYWINRATRAVFLEFSIYNANANLFAYVILLCEFPETGGTLIWTDVQSFRPVLSADEVGTYAVLCYVVLVAYLFGYLFRILYKTKTKGCLTFFKEPWNILDFIITFLGFSCCGVYIVRYLDAKKAMQMYFDNISTDTNKFINFGHIVVWDNLFNALFAVMVFLSVLKLLRILGYNRKFTEIISVVTNAGSEIAGFSIVFFVMFSAFVFFGYFLFGVHLEGYKSVFSTCSTLANTFIGKNKLDTLMVAAPKTAQFYYFTYMVSVIMTLLTMFAAILNKSISEVKAETAEHLTTIGILDICWKSAKNFLGMFFSFQGKRNDSNSGRENENIQKIKTTRTGSIEVTNVLALIRHTFNDFADFQNEKRKETEFSHLTMDENLDSRHVVVSDPHSKTGIPARRADTQSDNKNINLQLYL